MLISEENVMEPWNKPNHPPTANWLMIYVKQSLNVKTIRTMGRLVWYNLWSCSLILTPMTLSAFFCWGFSFCYPPTGSAFRAFSQPHGISAYHPRFSLGSWHLPSDSYSSSAWCSASWDCSTCCLSLEKGMWAGSERKITSTGNLTAALELSVS